MRQRQREAQRCRAVLELLAAASDDPADVATDA